MVKSLQFFKNNHRSTLYAWSQHFIKVWPEFAPLSKMALLTPKSSIPHAKYEKNIMTMPVSWLFSQCWTAQILPLIPHPFCLLLLIPGYEICWVIQLILITLITIQWIWKKLVKPLIIIFFAQLVQKRVSMGHIQNKKLFFFFFFRNNESMP